MEYRQLRCIWIWLALIVPLVPIAATFLPLLAQAMFPQDSGTLAATALVVGYSSGFGLTVFQWLVTRRLVFVQKTRADSEGKTVDSSWYSALATVEACWVILMTLLAVLGLMNVG